MLAISSLLTSENVLVNVGNNGVGIQNAVVDIRNEGVGVRNVVMDVRNSYVHVYCKLSLGIGVNNDRTKTAERTLNTRRIPLRSDLQPAILSLSLAAWKNLESAFRLPCSTVLLWISATVLRSDRKYRQWGTRGVHCRCNSRRELIDCLNYRVVEIIRTLPL